MHVQYEMIPCSGFIEELQNVRTSHKYSHIALIIFQIKQW